MSTDDQSDSDRRLADSDLTAVAGVLLSVVIWGALVKPLATL